MHMVSLISISCSSINKKKTVIFVKEALELSTVGLQVKQMHAETNVVVVTHRWHRDFHTTLFFLCITNLILLICLINKCDFLYGLNYALLYVITLLLFKCE